MFREGQYLEEALFPARIGYEASGVVDSIGDEVEGFAIGDKVSTIPAFAMSSHGVYGEYAYVPAHALSHYPENFSFQEAASTWMQYITAYGALMGIGKLTADQCVLITAASSSVGIASIQLAKAIGARVIATSRGTQKISQLKAHGADVVLDTDAPDFVQAMGEASRERGANVILDPIGGPLINTLAEVAAQGAVIIEYGALSPEPSPFPLFASLAKGLSIRGYTLFEVTKNPEYLNEAKAGILDLLTRNNIRPLIDKTFAFDDIRDAHQYMASNQQVGKIVVNI